MLGTSASKINSLGAADVSSCREISNVRLCQQSKYVPFRLVVVSFSARLYPDCSSVYAVRSGSINRQGHGKLLVMFERAQRSRLDFFRGEQVRKERLCEQEAQGQVATVPISLINIATKEEPLTEALAILVLAKVETKEANTECALDYSSIYLSYNLYLIWLVYK